MKIHWRGLKGQNETAFLILDIGLIFLISLDLLWLLVDAILLNSGFGVMLERFFPAMLHGYHHHWHDKLLVCDSIFTCFLIAELLLRWSVAVRKQTYYSWFFYPFVHWYDVLGCIPLPPFRALRLLRLVSIVWRLQKHNVVDFSETSFYQFFGKYYQIVLEELSDRIVVHVLDGVQQEIREGGPLTHRLADDVLKPRRDVIVPWLADLLARTSAQTYLPSREVMGQYLDARVRMAIAANAELQKLKRRLIFVGSPLEAELQQIVSDLLTQLMNVILSDISRPGNIVIGDVAAGLFDAATSPHEAMDEALRNILLDAIDLIKAQVSVQQWKKKYAASPDNAELVAEPINSRPPPLDGSAA